LSKQWFPAFFSQVVDLRLTFVSILFSNTMGEELNLEKVKAKLGASYETIKGKCEDDVWTWRILMKSLGITADDNQQKLHQQLVNDNFFKSNTYNLLITFIREGRKTEERGSTSFAIYTIESCSLF
jgi:hypothetical protein